MNTTVKGTVRVCTKVKQKENGPEFVYIKGKTNKAVMLSQSSYRLHYFLWEVQKYKDLLENAGARGTTIKQHTMNTNIQHCSNIQGG